MTPREIRWHGRWVHGIITAAWLLYVLNEATGWRRIVWAACRGHPATDGRVPVGELREEFRHDRRRHAEMAEDDPG